MKHELSTAQLAFTRAAVTTNDWDLYLGHARTEIHRLTGVYPDLPDYQNNLDRWVFPFGVRVNAYPGTPTDVVNGFTEQLTDLKLGQADLHLLLGVRSLFEYYGFRKDEDHANRYHCTQDYFQSNFFWFVLWVAGVELGNDFRIVNEWLDKHPQAKGSGAWEVMCEGIYIRRYQNGRMDMNLKPEHQVRAATVFATYARHRELETKANAAMRTEQEKQRQAFRERMTGTHKGRARA